MTEETKNAAISGPVGIVMSIIVSFVVGWLYLFGLTFSIQNELAVSGAPNEDGTANVGGVMQIFLDTTGTKGATLLGLIVLGAMFWCGMSSVTSNSRMVRDWCLRSFRGRALLGTHLVFSNVVFFCLQIYAFTRDGTRRAPMPLSVVM